MAINTAQQLNMADRFAVRNVIVNRCTQCVINFALYILNEAANAANHANRAAWAKEAMAQPDLIGNKVSYHVLNQTSYLNGGSSIDDDELKGIVETAIGNHFIPPETP